MHTIPHTIMHIMRNIEPAVPSMSGIVTARYEALVASATIERDPAQVDLVKKLDVLAHQLGERHNRSSRFDLGRLVGLHGSAGEELPGIYICGPAGRRKTMLMDLLFDSVDLAVKRRTHFYVFMADMRDRVQRVRDQIRLGEIGFGALRERVGWGRPLVSSVARRQGVPKCVS
jgi:cell division protein ZapE